MPVQAISARGPKGVQNFGSWKARLSSFWLTSEGMDLVDYDTIIEKVVIGLTYVKILDGVKNACNNSSNIFSLPNF